MGNDAIQPLEKSASKPLICNERNFGACGLQDFDARRGERRDSVQNFSHFCLAVTRSGFMPRGSRVGRDPAANPSSGNVSFLSLANSYSCSDWRMKESIAM